MALKTSPKRLTNSLHVKQHLRFSPDASHLVYARTIGAYIRLMKVKTGGGEEQLLFPDRKEDFTQQHPAWSPDGKQMACTINVGRRTGRIGISRCDADGMTFSNFRPWFTNGQDSHPQWSPDGKRVVFVESNLHVVVADANGNNRKQIGPVEGLQGQPCWSSDGTRIAFSSSHEGNIDVYTMQPDGKQLIRLTDSPRRDFRPVYSPDGQWIAFTWTRDGHHELYLMRPDGSELRNLTEHPGLDDHAAWNPDSRELAFISTRDGGYDVYRMRVFN